MPVNRPTSLRRLLLTHEIAFVTLVIISGALGASWAYVWQQWSEQSIRLNYLAHTAGGIRSQLYKQIQEVSVGGLRGDPSVRELNSAFVREMQELFNELRRKSSHRGEDYAVQSLQTSFSLLQANLRQTLSDPLALNRLVRSKLLDPSFEANFVAEFEAAFESLQGLIDLQLAEQEALIGRWTTYAPYAMSVPILIGIALLLFSRRSLVRGFVEPMQAVMLGTREISGGNLHHRLPQAGVAEVRELAQGINHMALELDQSREAVLRNEREAALGGLVPVVAHNIRNPLAAIRANAQLLDGRESVDEVAEVRQGIIDTVDRLSRWVTALVSYLHPLSPRKTTVAASQLINATATLLAPRLAQAGVSLRRATWNEQASLCVDPDLFEQAFYGLLNNALEASREGMTIELGIEIHDAEVRMWINDQAGGIPFQPEPSELTPGPTSKRFGTGLGIPVAYKICGILGIQLDFVVTAGGGTRVELSAPMAEEQLAHELK